MRHQIEYQKEKVQAMDSLWGPRGIEYSDNDLLRQVHSAMSLKLEKAGNNFL